MINISYIQVIEFSIIFWFSLLSEITHKKQYIYVYIFLRSPPFKIKRIGSRTKHLCDKILYISGFSLCKLTVGEKAHDGQFALFSAANFRLIAKEKRGWRHTENLSLWFRFFLLFFFFLFSRIPRCGDVSTLLISRYRLCGHVRLIVSRNREQSLRKITRVIAKSQF